MNVANGVELGAADPVITSQGTLLDGYAFKSVLIFCHYEGNEVVSTQGGKEVNHSRTLREAFDNRIHSVRAFNFKKQDGSTQV